MRIYKFRAWLPRHKIMVYSDSGDDNSFFNLDVRGISVEYLETVDSNPGGTGHEQEEKYVYQDDAIIMEYLTEGLYLGDFVKGYNSGATGKIVYSDFEGKYYIDDGIGWEEDILDQCVLLGNEWENPELLKLKITKGIE